MQVFQTPDDCGYEIEIAGVGVAGPYGRASVPIDRAARTMPELQETDDRGYPKLDENGSPQPLTGSKLTAAAKAFAEARGLVVKNLSEEHVFGGDPNDRGALAELGPEDALLASQAYAERIGVPLKTNTDPEEMNQSAEDVLPPSVILADEKAQQGEGN